jgi:hypothetical protein
MKRKPEIFHFHEREYAKQLLDCKAWTQGSSIHFHSINQVQDHLEIWLYVKGKLTEKLIFDKQ